MQQQLSYSNEQLAVRQMQLQNILNPPQQPNYVQQNFHQPQIFNYTQNAFYSGSSPYNQPYPTNATLGSAKKHSKAADSPERSQQQLAVVRRNQKRPISAYTQHKVQEAPPVMLLQPYYKSGVNGSSDLTNSNYRRKLIPVHMQYEKEDLYDQTITLKLNLNDYKEDNVRLQTRLAQMIGQLKDRDKLIDDLYKTAFITASGTMAKANLNKNVLLMINLKRKVQDLKDSVYVKDAEIGDLKKD